MRLKANSVEPWCQRVTSMFSEDSSRPFNKLITVSISGSSIELSSATVDIQYKQLDNAMGDNGMTRFSHLAVASLLAALLIGCSTDDAPEQEAAAATQIHETYTAAQFSRPPAIAWAVRGPMLFQPRMAICW